MTFNATAVAHILADYGLTDSDAATTADLIAAADLAGCGHPIRGQQDDIRAALDTIGDQP
ncbi:hypothetical protein ACIRF8_15075 [Streptomyces sp. NPDC102406]|uniref:hypothetical protein n=1 Tax=Streptomyces sp. NPDC102406 TaxID=3366171 RepID=UPI00382E31CF